MEAIILICNEGDMMSQLQKVLKHRKESQETSYAVRNHQCCAF